MQLVLRNRPIRHYLREAIEPIIDNHFSTLLTDSIPYWPESNEYVNKFFTKK